MSYSIQARGATKDEAKAALAKQFDDTVLRSQPVHAHDRNAALTAANSFIDLLVDNPDKDVVVNMNGYLSWIGEADFVGANVAISATLIART